MRSKGTKSGVVNKFKGKNDGSWGINLATDEKNDSGQKLQSKHIEASTP